ncbi:hypothetical protein DH2020_029698 [Rehmannia glutinosa]|uniref:Protein kinase domain-containing protein n=1 Tax=Rehmannia glutinosa TaxID=99300 RepID=A0ABR0VRE3_REHGL
MSRNYDNWERLVDATLLREKLRQIGRENSLSSISSSDYFTWSFREIDSPLANLSSLGISFSYQQIALASDLFSDDNLIKRGHSGDLYTGQLSGPVVVKRFYFHNREAFTLELGFFSRIKSHPRFVPLLGHCFEMETEKFLVYIYSPERDLSNSLFINNPDRPVYSLPSLDWITRWKIARGVAEGLAYLHHECNPPLVHGKSKTDTSGNPKTTCDYDIYCFGKVLLELVTGKLGISSSLDATKIEFLFQATLRYINVYDKDLITNIVDPSLNIHEDHLEEVWAMGIVARACLNPSPTRRPQMKHILKALEDPLTLLREKMSWMPVIHNVETE